MPDPLPTKELSFGRMMMLDFTGQVVLITGAGPLKGLNRTIAHSFGRQGANIAICGINNDDVDAAAKELLSIGYESIGFVANLSEKKSADNLVELIVKLYGRIDVLVNNDGNSQTGAAANMTVQQCVFDLSPITQVVCEVMKKQKYGRIVNISSASKPTRQRFSRNLARKISQHYVNSYCVYPGLINTDIRVSMPQELSEVLIANISMDSSGKVQEIADAIMFLASRGASYMADGTLID